MDYRTLQLQDVTKDCLVNTGLIRKLREEGDLVGKLLRRLLIGRFTPTNPTSRLSGGSLRPLGILRVSFVRAP